MSLQSLATDAESIARLFRSRILKPAEGVFLFHPRAMERLIADDLAARGDAGAIPALHYYLMPAPAFLTGLELENPEALAVIEGLSLPEQVILLPMPLEPPLDHAGLVRSFREYWARRFEGEIARGWQSARDAHRGGDGDPFGPAALEELIGTPAFVEVRDILARDGIIPAGLEDALVCRGFVARVTRLRYFSPGVRGFFFPAIHDWAQVDRWICDSGLDLPAAAPDQPLPPLLARTRPDPDCGQPALTPLLPRDLPYALADPAVDSAPLQDETAGATRHAADSEPLTEPGVTGLHAHPREFDLSALHLIDPPLDAPAARHAARYLAALRDGLQPPRQDWRALLRDTLLGILAPLLDLLLALAARLRWRASPALRTHGFCLELSLTLFRHAVRAAWRAELDDRYAAAIAQLAAAHWRCRTAIESDTPEGERVKQVLSTRQRVSESALSALLAAKWQLDPDQSCELQVLIRRLGAEVIASPRARVARAVLKNLERVLLESRTTYYRLRPFRWLFSLGSTHFRQILPFQANLKALRAFDNSLNRLEQLGWPTADAERFGRPLQALARRLTVHLEKQLKPLLQSALENAGFNPGNHREQVAAHKLLRELLDVIEYRRHLKFTDVRDIVARNVLRLPDFTPAELLKGDRLARFDRTASRALPGVYQPGEFYLKGLQQLGAPLFGTPLGRLALRHLVLPFGLAFLGLKTLHVLIDLLTHHRYDFDLTPLWLVGSVGFVINAIAYAPVARNTALALLRGLWWGLRLLFYDGLRRFLRWQPIARLLENSLIRGLDRNLIRPFVIGALLVLPFLGFASLLEGSPVEPGASLFALALALGTLVRNTPVGRRLLDDVASTVGRFLRLVNQTLIIGLVRELMQFFKEVTRRFQQGLHWIEELLSHRLGESRQELALKAVLIPLWRLLDSLIQFYVTVLVEPQVNPIKHFPLVSIGHKVMLPFFPAITSFLFAVTATLLPKWIAYPIVTLTVLLLPGLAGFLVWELKENWKLYAANHATAGMGSVRSGLQARPRRGLPDDPIEPAIIGRHGETMRGLLRRGFHSGTLPKAFDRLRRVLRQQIRDETDLPARLREARRHLADIERAICVFCDRELAYALRRRCRNPHCNLARIETRRPRLATASFELTLELWLPESPAPIALRLCFCLLEPELQLRVAIGGPHASLNDACWRLVREDIRVFSGRAGASRTLVELDSVKTPV